VVTDQQTLKVQEPLDHDRRQSADGDQEEIPDGRVDPMTLPY
jgi:hypothetical protein